MKEINNKGGFMHKILLVEDSVECQVVVRSSLAEFGFEILIAQSCEKTRELVSQRGCDFDLVILDLGLPDGDGFDALEILRNAGLSSDTPIFFLTSEAETNSKVTAFQLGADDYLLKPISPVELRARVEMRIKKSSSVTELIHRGDLVIDKRLLRASRVENQKQIDLSLTGKEFKILNFLVQNDGHLFSRAELVDSIWGAEVHVLDRTVDSHIYGMRKKMGPLASYIECVSGLGYRFSVSLVKSLAG